MNPHLLENVASGNSRDNEGKGSKKSESYAKFDLHE
ncbi:uncharacterized protein G2W53_028427 [Senna tora]|uniref:Uncharacterized protein n=1 Tax=Senna tora TaxID=362788 RepID=A0A834WAL9_9FABA|nr:uncharacterized protein G2W53_028427 [Senna tora]